MNMNQGTDNFRGGITSQMLLTDKDSAGNPDSSPNGIPTVACGHPRHRPLRVAVGRGGDVRPPLRRRAWDQMMGTADWPRATAAVPQIQAGEKAAGRGGRGKATQTSTSGLPNATANARLQHYEQEHVCCTRTVTGADLRGGAGRRTRGGPAGPPPARRCPGAALRRGAAAPGGAPGLAPGFLLRSPRGGGGNFKTRFKNRAAKRHFPPKKLRSGT